MPSLDELSAAYPAPKSTEAEERQASFIADFGDITGTFVQNGSDTEFHSTLGDKQVVIRIQLRRGTATEYVIRGDTWHLAGDVPNLTLEERQEQLIRALRFYLSR